MPRGWVGAEYLLSGSLFTSRIITDDVECYDRSNRLREVVFAVLVNKNNRVNSDNSWSVINTFKKREAVSLFEGGRNSEIDGKTQIIICIIRLCVVNFLYLCGRK